MQKGTFRAYEDLSDLKFYGPVNIVKIMLSQ